MADGGLRAKKIESTYSAEFHVARRGAYDTQFISLTRRLETVRAYQQATLAQKGYLPKIVKVDLSKIDMNIWDLTNMSVRESLILHPRTRNYASTSSEVLVEFHIRQTQLSRNCYADMV